MLNTLDKTSKRLLRYLLVGMFFMVAGALFYASQTESLDYCQGVYEPHSTPQTAPKMPSPPVPQAADQS